MKYALARLLQVLGLATVALGFYVGISMDNARVELIYLGVGVAIFYAGRLLQGKDKE